MSSHEEERIKEEKIKNYTLDSLYPMYQNFIQTLQSRLKTSFQKYGVHDNTLKEFMYAWELQVRNELKIAYEDTIPCEMEVDMLLEEFDDLVMEDGSRNGSKLNSNGQILQMDGEIDINSNNQNNNFDLSIKQLNLSNHSKLSDIQNNINNLDSIFQASFNVNNNSFELCLDNPKFLLNNDNSNTSENDLYIKKNVNLKNFFLQVDGEYDDTFNMNTSFQVEGEESNNLEPYIEDKDFNIKDYMAPVNENDFEDVLICQYSDIKNEKSKGKKRNNILFNMELVRGVLYCGGRDFLFSKAKGSATFKSSEKKSVITNKGAVISNVGATARMQTDNYMDLNITELTKKIQNAEYDPQKFGGHHIQIRRDNPRSTSKIFKAGTINVIGCADESDARKAVYRAAALIQYLGVENATIKDFKITSINATYNYGQELNLKLIKAFRQGDYVEESVEEGSTITYVMKNPNLKIKINKTGNVQFIDAKSVDDIDKCIDIIIHHFERIVTTSRQQQIERRNQYQAPQNSFNNRALQQSQTYSMQNISMGMPYTQQSFHPSIQEHFNNIPIPIQNDNVGRYLNESNYQQGNVNQSNTFKQNTQNQANSGGSTQWRSFEKNSDFEF